MKRLLIVACACAAAAVIAAMPAVGATSPKSSAKVSAADAHYLKSALAGDLFEITGGKLAKAKSNNPAVIKLADRLITDHTKSFSANAALARRLGVEVPKSPLPTQVWDLRIVASLRGKAFNHWYSSLALFGHVEAIQEAIDEVKDGTNAQVRESARTEIPTLREHLALARAALNANP